MSNQELLTIRDDFLAQCANNGISTRHAGIMFDKMFIAFAEYHKPKPLRKRFFNMLRRWAVAHESRKQYRRGMAEARVIVDEYRQSNGRFINNKSLTVALQARKEELWNDANLQFYRFNIRAGFDSQWSKEQPAIDRIMNRGG